MKPAIFDGGQILSQGAFPDMDQVAMTEFTGNHPVQNAIISSTRDLSEAFINQLQRKFNTFILDSDTPLPIQLDYETPTTLGSDRIAAVIGALEQFPEHNCLAITLGTCITYNYITTEGTFKGGGIAPGLLMRFNAMHSFTDQLPLVQNDDKFDALIGTSTEKSMLSGARNGIIAEVDGIISEYKNRYNPIAVVISGGDTSFFETRLKNKIFADPNVVLKGLNKILEYNLNR